MRWIALPALVLFLSAPAPADDRDRELRCEEIRQRIEYLYAKMRAGYTRAQGEKMEAELRKLRALRRKACR
jgi:hypothetical protein